MGGPGASAAAPSTAAAARLRPSAAGCGATQLADDIATVGQDLSERVTQLNSLTNEANNSAGLTSADKATLLSDLSNELAGIQALQAKVPTDTTCAAVRADGRAMVVNYRVYLVMTPQVHLTNSADTESNLAGRLAVIEPALQDAINAAAAKGQNVAAAQADYNDLVSQVSAAEADTSGIAASVLGFTPASYPGCWSSFLADRANLRKGQAALHQANKDLHAIIQAVG